MIFFGKVWMKFSVLFQSGWNCLLSTGIVYFTFFVVVVFCDLLSNYVSLSFFSINLFICLYLFLAALGLRCCTWAFFSYVERGLLFLVVRRLLTAVASLVAEHGL